MPDFSSWGIEGSYRDDFGHWHEPSAETKSALVSAMGGDLSDPFGGHPPPDHGLLIINQGEERSLSAPSEILLEDGSRLTAHFRLPAELPLGYHRLRDIDTLRETHLVVAPKKCFLPQNLRTWGWAIQLYALRSRASWGIGDFEDLRRFADWSTEKLHAGVIMTNPLCASTPGLPQQRSPYYPCSRLFLNPLYLRIELVPGSRAALPDFENLAARGLLLNEQPEIDRNAVYRLKMQALETIWAHTRDHVHFPAYEKTQGATLESFAIFCAIAEKHGPSWRAWPINLRRPDSSGINNFCEASADRIRFHKWLQFLLDEQLKSASRSGILMQDLPVGVDPDGADAWMWQDVFAPGVRVGAPPDLFNANGQDWGLPPFIPHKLRAAGYQPFIQTVRAAFKYTAALRIDHVMGLFRLFWIPAGGPSAHGAYVRYNAQEMLSILALESVRARSFVVGEDLGTVDDGVREKLAEFSILSYRLLWFEEKRPEHYPALAVAAVSTHDLPTIAGIWSGSDFAEQENLGLKPLLENAQKMRHHLRVAAAIGDHLPVNDVVVKTHEALSLAPSAVVMASIDDALCMERRPNLPAAPSDARANWSIPLPKYIDEIESDPTVLDVAKALRR